MADHLENLFDLLDKSWMIDWLGQLDVTEMTRAFVHAFTASSTLELTVNGTETWVVQAILPGLRPGFVHGLRILDSADGHVLDLLRREETKLDLFDGLEWRIAVRKMKVRPIDHVRSLYGGGKRFYRFGRSQKEHDSDGNNESEVLTIL